MGHCVLPNTKLNETLYLKARVLPLAFCFLLRAFFTLITFFLSMLSLSTLYNPEILLKFNGRHLNVIQRAKRRIPLAVCCWERCSLLPPATVFLSLHLSVASLVLRAWFQVV